MFWNKNLLPNKKINKNKIFVLVVDYLKLCVLSVYRKYFCSHFAKQQLIRTKRENKINMAINYLLCRNICRMLEFRNITYNVIDSVTVICEDVFFFFFFINSLLAHVKWKRTLVIVV